MSPTPRGSPGQIWRHWVQRWTLARTRAGRLAIRFLPSESQHLFALTLLVGVTCGLVAVAFHVSIQLAERALIGQALAAPGSQWMVWTVLTPALGGLAGGVLLQYAFPRARGSGIPQVKEVYALEGGRVRVRDAVGKFIVSTLQIGSGASLGREGPTVHICAGVASLLGRATFLPPKARRRLIPVGAAAGIAAAFNAPIAAVTFTIEEVVGDLDQTVLSGVVIAAAVAAVVERSVLGIHPILEMKHSYGLEHPSSLLFYALLGVVSAGASVAFTDSLLKVRTFFQGLHRVPPWVRPGIGGLLTGALALPMIYFFHTRGTFGGGYETLSQALEGQLPLKVMLAMAVVKLLATVFSYSSGGAGGIFAPVLFIGAMLGGAFGFLDSAALGHSNDQLGAFALVGMGAVFAGVIRAPMTSVLIIFELTGGYGLVLPLMIANMTAYGLARAWRPLPVYEALLEQDGIHLPHHGGLVAQNTPALQVDATMTPTPVTLHSKLSISAALAQIEARPFPAYPVVADGGRFVGLARGTKLRELAAAGQWESLLETLPLAQDSVGPSAPIVEVVMTMAERGVRQLAVVAEDGRVLGVVSMSDVLRAHARLSGPVRPPAQNLGEREPSSQRVN